MEINVKLSLSIGINNARQEDAATIDVPDNFRELSADERQEILDDVWREWIGNYIDGYVKEIE